MLLLTVAVAVSAWLFYHGSGSDNTTLQIQHARTLRDFVAHNLTVSQEISIEFGNRGFRFPDLVRAAQLQLDFRLRNDGVPYKYPLIDRLPEYVSRPPTETERALAKEPLLTPDTLATSEMNSVTVDSYSSMSPLELKNTTLSDNSNIVGKGLIEADSTFSNKTKSIESIPEYSVELHFQDVPRLSLDLVQKRVYLAYNLHFAHQNDLPFYLTQAIYDMLLKPDLGMRQEILAGTRNFSDVTRRLKVNFVAAEESGQTRPQIAEAIREHMRQFEAIADFVDIVPHMHVLDVSKRRAAPHLLTNTSSEMTFFYSTTMRPYASAIEGVFLHHLDPIPKETSIDGDIYGTEYQQRMRASKTDTYNVTSLLQEVSASIKQAIHLPECDSSNLRLMTDSAMKHYTLLGLVETLDLILQEGQFESRVFEKVALIVDEILQESQHNWGKCLSEVTALYKEGSNL